MDHLPSPEKPFAPGRVYYCGLKYDEGPLETYPERLDLWKDSFSAFCRPFLRPETDTAGSWPQRKIKEILNILDRNDQYDDASQTAMLETKGYIELMTAELREAAATNTVAKYALMTVVGETQAAEINIPEMTVGNILKWLSKTSETEFEQTRHISGQKFLGYYRAMVRIARLLLQDRVDQRTCHFLQNYPLHLEMPVLDTVYENVHCRLIGQAIQAWLFFGFLFDVFSRILDISFNQDDFIRHEPEYALITTSKLNEYIALWKQKHAASTEAENKDTGSRILEVFDIVAEQISRFESIDRNTDLDGSSITLSVAIVLETMQNVYTNLYREGSSLECPSSKMLRSLFLTGGWCPNQIVEFKERFTIAWQYFIYQIGPMPPRHTSDRCTALECGANRVDETTYKVPHVRYDSNLGDSEASCAVCGSPTGPEDIATGFFSPDPQLLVDIVRNGDVPLISYRSPKSGDVDLDPMIVSYTPKSEQYDFATVSHVWADGIGNPFSNSIRRCQLASIAKIYHVEDAGEDASDDPGEDNGDENGEAGGVGNSGERNDRAYIWIDTVCIPLAPADIRYKAIQSIVSIFKEATYTFVISNDLRYLEPPSSSLEAITRIITSNWNRRLWTYSEALISKSLLFFFNTTTLDLSNELEDLEEHEADNSSFDGLVVDKKFSGGVMEVPWLKSGLIEFILAIPSSNSTSAQMSAKRVLKQFAPGKVSSKMVFEMDEPEYRKAYCLERVLVHLRWKATSFPFDEIICLAQLLSIDLNTILPLISDCREAWKEWYRLQHAIPPAIFLFSYKRRDARDCDFNWMPETLIGGRLMHSDLTSVALFDEPALLSRDGLIFRFAGFRICASRAAQETPWFVTVPKHVRHQIQLFPGRDIVYTIRFDGCVPTLYPEEWHNLALVVATREKISDHGQTHYLGALVIVTSHDTDFVHARYVCNVRLMIEDVYHWILKQREYGILSVGEEFPVTQPWCMN